MTRLVRIVTVVLLLAGGIASAAVSRGTAVPNVALTAADGSAVTLDQYRSQGPVILWFTNFSPSVDSSIHELTDLADRYRTRGLTILAVNLNGSTAEFARRYGGQVTVLTDPRGTACRTFTGEYLEGTTPLNNLFVISREGVVRAVRHFPGVPPKLLEGDLAAALP